MWENGFMTLLRAFLLSLSLTRVYRRADTLNLHGLLKVVLSALGFLCRKYVD